MKSSATAAHMFLPLPPFPSIKPTSANRCLFALNSIENWIQGEQRTAQVAPSWETALPAGTFLSIHLLQELKVQRNLWRSGQRHLPSIPFETEMLKHLASCDNSKVSPLPEILFRCGLTCQTPWRAASASALDFSGARERPRKNSKNLNIEFLSLGARPPNPRSKWHLSPH